MCLLSSLMNETQNLRISLSDLPLGSKSAPPLPPPMLTAIYVNIKYAIGQAGQLTSGKRILEDLLETQELEDGEIYSGVESETALVWAESGVELHAVSFVDLALALVVLPDHAEL